MISDPCFPWMLGMGSIFLLTAAGMYCDLLYEEASSRRDIHRGGCVGTVEYSSYQWTTGEQTNECSAADGTCPGALINGNSFSVHLAANVTSLLAAANGFCDGVSLGQTLLLHGTGVTAEEVAGTQRLVAARATAQYYVHGTSNPNAGSHGFDGRYPLVNNTLTPRLPHWDARYLRAFRQSTTIVAYLGFVLYGLCFLWMFWVICAAQRRINAEARAALPQPTRTVTDGKNWFVLGPVSDHVEAFKGLWA